MLFQKPQCELDNDARAKSDERFAKFAFILFGLIGIGTLINFGLISWAIIYIFITEIIK